MSSKDRIVSRGSAISPNCEVTANFKARLSLISGFFIISLSLHYWF